MNGFKELSTMFQNKITPPPFFSNDFQPHLNIVGNPSIISYLSRGAQFVLNEVIWYSLKYRFAYPTQVTIAKNTGYCREYVNRLIGVLVSLGVIKKHSRGFKRSRSYTISKWFLRSEIYLKLQDVLPALKALRKPNVTHKIFREDILNISVQLDSLSHERELDSLSTKREEPKIETVGDLFRKLGLDFG